MIGGDFTKFFGLLRIGIWALFFANFASLPTCLSYFFFIRFKNPVKWILCIKTGASNWIENRNFKEVCKYFNFFCHIIVARRDLLKMYLCAMIETICTSKYRTSQRNSLKYKFNGFFFNIWTNKNVFKNGSFNNQMGRILRCIDNMRTRYRTKILKRSAQGLVF